MSTKKAVLIAESSLAMVQLYKGLLAAYDCVVHTVTSIADAKDLMVVYDYELYIIDTNLDNGEDGAEIIGRGGADPKKCLVLSGNLPEEKVTELVDYHKVPRNMIMVKPPDAKAFIEIANKHLTGSESPDGTVVTSDENGPKLTIIKNIKKWFSNLTLRGWLTIIFFVLLLPTTIKTTSIYIGYRQHLKFDAAKEEYCFNRFKSFKAGEEITESTYVEVIHKHKEATYVIRFYPDRIMHIRVVPTDKSLPAKECWMVGSKYLKTLGLRENMTFVDILKSAISF